MRNILVWAGAILVGSASGCAGSTPRATAPAPTATESAGVTNLDALFAREADAPLRSIPITVLEGSVSGTVDAASAPKMKTEENEEGGLVSIVDVPIGTEVPLTCIFRTERLDPGVALQQMMTPVAAAGPARGGQPFAPDVKVSVAGGVPILSVTAAFVENGAPSLAKIAVATSDDGTVICTHFEAGYRATFARHVEKIVGALRYARPQPAPRWHEVRLHELGAGTAYVEVDVFEGEKAGQSVSRSFFAGFVQLQGKWLGVDGARRETYETKGGAVLDKTTALYVAGTMVSEVKLTRTRPGEYAYKGKVRDAAVDGTFKSRAPITSDASRAAQVRSWLSGRKTEARFATYDELEDPKGPIGVVFKREAGRTVTVETLGAKTSTHRCTIDAQGLFESEEEAGTEGTRETRLFARGTL